VHARGPVGLFEQTRLRDFYTNPGVHRSALMARFPRRFEYFDDFHPIASLESNFDSILIPQSHVSRSRC